MKAGRIIKTLRTAEGLSQGDLAQELGVTRAYLSQLENGRKQASLNLLRAMSKRLRVPLVLLLADDEDAGVDAEVLDEMRRLLASLIAAKIGIEGGRATTRTG